MSEHESSKRGMRVLDEGIKIERHRALNPQPEALKPRVGNDESSNNGEEAWHHADAMERKRSITRRGE